MSSIPSTFRTSLPFLKSLWDRVSGFLPSVTDNGTACACPCPVPCCSLDTSFRRTIQCHTVLSPLVPTFSVLLGSDLQLPANGTTCVFPCLPLHHIKAAGLWIVIWEEVRRIHPEGVLLESHTSRRIAPRRRDMAFFISACAYPRVSPWPPESTSRSSVLTCAPLLLSLGLCLWMLSAEH